MAAIIFVEAPGGQVTIEDLEIDGSSITEVPVGVDSDWVAGLAYLETSGTVEGLSVIGNPNIGCRAAGIWASAITETTSVEVTGCNVIGYNRAGIYALGEELEADYNNNEINGPGISYTVGQVPNGMFFLEYATGSATYNIVTDLSYTGETWRSTGIGTYRAGEDIIFNHNDVSFVQNAFCLSYDSIGTTVEYNIIHDCHTGIRIESGTSDNIIRYNDIHDNTYAIRCGEGMGSGNVAHYNNFVDNIGTDEAFPEYNGAVSNLHEENVLDATYNWWGHASGPSGPDGRKNPRGKTIGKGDSVMGFVYWDPWLPQPVGRTPHDPVPPGLK